MNQEWDEQYDVVVVGSGAGGMTAALCAAGEGLSALVVEKSDQFGGTAAVSGGGIWIPCNQDMARNGQSDSFEEALHYLQQLTLGEVPDSRLKAYLRNCTAMVAHLASRFDVHFRSVPKYPDYYPQLDGGKDGGRSMEPVPFDARKLGDDFDRQRPAFRGTQLMGRVSMDTVEAHILFSKASGWVWLFLKMMWRYWSDFSWRKKTHRDRRQVLGQALTGSLRHALAGKNVPLELNTGFKELVVEQGRVTGIVVEQDGKTRRIAARRGVILASGGFESNQQMRERFLPKPTQAAWTAAPPINHGEGIAAGEAAGAALQFMDLTWGAPTVNVPGASSQSALFVERCMPGCLLVNQKGQRFVNEAAAYPDIVTAMFQDDAKGNGCVPCWMIFDARFRHKYPAGLFLPGQIQPDSKLPKSWLDSAFYRAETLAALAAKIGVDADGLRQSVRQLNAYAETGVDEAFGKGGTSIDRYYSDPHNQPNSCLGPVDKPPFYALRLDPGEIGTKGGLAVNEQAQVLREDGSCIDGLYAIGNCSAAVMGRTYAGAGSTIGPAMTFAYLAALHLARSESPAGEEATELQSAAA